MYLREKELARSYYRDSICGIEPEKQIPISRFPLIRIIVAISFVIAPSTVLQFGIKQCVPALANDTALTLVRIALFFGSYHVIVGEMS